jgi:uncharacterized protein YdcH (DUF465 family)
MSFSLCFRVCVGAVFNLNIRGADKRRQANVMMEFDVREALALLESKDALVRKEMQSLAEDVDFLKDQITTMEVNIAKVHNHQVSQRKRADGVA